MDSAILGSRFGLARLMTEKNIMTIHRHCQSSKTLPVDLSNIMKLAMKMMNVVKNSALNTRILRKLYAVLDSDHETLLFYIEVH